MQHVSNVLIQEISYAWRQRTHARRMMSPTKLYSYLHYLGLRLKLGETWSHEGRSTSFMKRAYRHYEEYLNHQKTKLGHINLSDYDVMYRHALQERLENLETSLHGKSVLCLAARIGTEVKAFRDVGCFAIGIDLNPGKRNPYVLYGDFHDLQFPDNSFDMAFTNSVDHVFDIKRFSEETKRVLKPGGLFIVEAMRGREEGKSPGFYESFYWPTIDALISEFQNYGFRLINRSSFTYPWKGEQLVFGSQ